MSPSPSSPGKRRPRLVWLTSGVVIAVIIVVGWVMFSTVDRDGVSQDRGQSAQIKNLSPCPNEPFLTHALALAEEYVNILPLGNLAPPGHTTPTEHLYFQLQRNPNDRALTVPATIMAPTGGRLIQVAETIRWRANQVINQDYDLLLAPCDEVRVFIAHVAKPVPKLAAAIEAADRSQCSDHEEGTLGSRNRFCVLSTDVGFTAGELIGTSSGERSVGAFDLGIYDTRVEPLKYVNPSRYRPKADKIDSLHRACPLDYFVEPLRSQLYAKLGSFNRLRTVAPRCGTIMQDVAGTLQGNWWLDNEGTAGLGTWPKQLAFVLDNVDPTRAVVSVGGTLTEFGTLMFTPRSVGVINRAFVEVTPGLTIFCFEPDGGQSNTPVTGRVLAQLVDDDTLNVEHQAGACTSTPAFQDPFTYNR